MPIPDTTISASSGNFDAWLKERFPLGSKYWTVINRYTAGLDVIENGNNVKSLGGELQDGKYLKFPGITRGRPNAAVPGGEGSPDPLGGETKKSALLCNVTTLRHTFSMTGFALDQFTGPSVESKIADLFDVEMQQLAEDARVSMGQQVMDDGSGRYTTISAISGDTITVGDTSLLMDGSEFEIRADLTGAYYPGHPTTESLKVYGEPISATQVRYRLESGAAGALSDNAAITGYTFYRFGAQGLGLNGMQNICSSTDPTNWGSSTATFMGVSAATEPWWRANELDCGGATLSIQSHLEVIRDQTRRRARSLLPTSEEGVIWHCFTGYQNMRAAQHASTLDSRVAQGQNREFMYKSRYPAFNFEGMLFIVDHFAPPSQVLCMYAPDVYRYVLRDWHWDSRDGSIYRRQKHPVFTNRGTDAFDLYAYTRQQIACLRRISQARLYNLRATS